MTNEPSNIFTINLDEAVEPQILDDGEFLLRVIMAETRVSKTGNKYLNIRFDVPDQPHAEDIYHIIMAPNGKDAKQDNRNALAAKSFYKAFGIEPDENWSVDLDSLGGKTGWALLTIKNDEQYGDKNAVRRFVTGK